MPDIDDLQFVRTFDFRYIPESLFRQAKEIDEGMIERIYTIGQLIAQNPLTLLYVMVDQTYVIKGVLWANIDPIDAVLFIRFLSVYPEYQSSNGQLLNKVKDFLFNLETGPELKKEIHFFTSRPGAYEKIGAKKSRRIKMEIHNGEDNKDNTKRDNTPDTVKPTEQ